MEQTFLQITSSVLPLRTFDEQPRQLEVQFISISRSKSLCGSQLAQRDLCVDEISQLCQDEAKVACHSGCLEAGLICRCVSYLRDELGKLSFFSSRATENQEKNSAKDLLFLFLTPLSFCNCTQLQLLPGKMECGARLRARYSRQVTAEGQLRLHFPHAGLRQEHQIERS